METENSQTISKKKRGKKSSEKIYFNDAEMKEVLNMYNKTHSQIYLNKLIKGFNKIIDGMINKHYRNNYNIYTLQNINGVAIKNFDVARADCIYNIFKSLHLYNTDRSLFSYMNRVIKNTLTQMSNRNEKINSNEFNFSDIYNDDINEDFNDSCETNVDNIYYNQSNITENGSLPEESISIINPVPMKKSMTVKSSLYIIYKYISYLYDCVQFFYSNDEHSADLINNIKYDSSVDFSFDDDNTYYELIDKLYNMLYSYKTLLETEYAEEIKCKPTNYLQGLSNRSLSYIRRHFKTKIKKEFDTMQYGGIDEIIKFLQYIVIKKETVYDGI